MGAVGRNVVIVDLQRRERISSSHPISHPSSATFSANGEVLAVKATSGHIVVLNPATGVLIGDHRNKSDGEGSNIACSPDGAYLVDGSWDGLFTVRHMLTGQILLREEFRDEMIRRVTHDERRQRWAIEHQPKAQGGQPPPPGYISVIEWPFSSLRSAKVVRLGRRLDAPTISPDGERICFRDRYSNELLVAGLDGEILARAPLQTGGTGSDLAWSIDARVIGAIGSDGFMFFRGSDLAPLGHYPAQYPSSVLFHPKGKDVLLGTWERSWAKPLGEVCDAES